MFYNLNSNIRYLRKLNNKTVPQLAKELNLSTQSLTNVECGNGNVSLEVLVKLHDIFNISTDDIIFKNLSGKE